MPPKVIVFMSSMWPHTIRQEVQLMAELDHPSLVKVYEFSEDRRQSRSTAFTKDVRGVKGFNGFQALICEII